MAGGSGTLVERIRQAVDGEEPLLAAEALHGLAREKFMEAVTGETAPTDDPRRARVIEVNGERLTMTQWARRLGVPRRTLHDRVESEGVGCIAGMLASKASRRAS